MKQVAKLEVSSKEQEHFLQEYDQSCSQLKQLNQQLQSQTSALE
jgi:hypothetical protein